MKMLRRIFTAATACCLSILIALAIQTPALAQETTPDTPLVENAGVSGENGKNPVSAPDPDSGPELLTIGTEPDTSLKNPADTTTDPGPGNTQDGAGDPADPDPDVEGDQGDNGISETPDEPQPEPPAQEPHYGWYLTEEGYYYYDPATGNMLTGWQYINGAWYYLDADNTEHPGLMAVNEQKMIGGAYYRFGSSGAMLTGWQNDNGIWYYSYENGVMATGWLWDNAWYYLDGSDAQNPGRMAANGWILVDGTYYYLNGSGVMLTDWQQINNIWYYMDGSGAMLTGWQKIGDTWYYLYDNGAMATGWLNDNGTWYYLYGSGAMATGWVSAGPWYYMDGSGAMLTGWQKVGGYWYYMNESGAMLTDWQQIGGTWYYLDGSGVMATGWRLLNNIWYYMDGSGAMLTDWQQIDGYWYYFYSGGAMASGTTIDGYPLDSSGRWVTSTETSMHTKAQGYSSSTSYLILVDRGARKVGIYSGSQGNWSNIRYWDCTVGAPGTPTITGTYTIGDKGRYFDHGATVRCHYWTRIHGNYLFHSTLYNRFTGKPSDSRLGMALSEGCIRLYIDNAKWIYDNIPRGTTVVIY